MASYCARRRRWHHRISTPDEGFTIHPDKTRVRRTHQRQQLTGLVVNSWPAVPRQEYDNLRALLHNCIATGPVEQNLQDRNDVRAHVYGRIARIGETNETRRARLLSMASQIEQEKFVLSSWRPPCKAKKITVPGIV